MIVPFGMIPSQFMLPLNVETKMEYTINKNKFPGLKDKTRAHHPALLIATKPGKDDSENSQESPIDLSKTAPNQNTVCCSNNKNTESRHRHSVRRGSNQCTGTSRIRPRPTGNREVATSAVSTQSDVPRPPGGLAADVLAMRQSYGVPVCGTEMQTTGNSRKTTHPSYLDFIYGENGLLAKNNTEGNKEKKPSVTTTGKRKRELAEDSDSGVTDNHLSKRCKSSFDSDKQGSKPHTIHYMPTAASMLSGKAPKEPSSLFYTSVQHMWPSAVPIGAYNDQIITTSRRTFGRES